MAEAPMPNPQDQARDGTATAANAPAPETHAVWTVEAVRALGVRTTIETAASVLGIGRTHAYALARTGEFPVRLLRIGRRYVVPVQALLDLLEIK